MGPNTIKFAGVELDESVLSISFRNERNRDVRGAHARVETAGDVDRRVTATRLLLTGPLAFGLRKKKDHRALFLTVEGVDFAWAVDLNPNRYKAAQEFAARVNAFATRDHGYGEPAFGRPEVELPAPTALPPPATSRAAPQDHPRSEFPQYLKELRELADLRREGILTEDEFEAQKRRLLP